MWPAEVSARKEQSVCFRDLNALRLDASANYLGPCILSKYPNRLDLHAMGVASPEEFWEAAMLLG